MKQLTQQMKESVEVGASEGFESVTAQFENMTQMKLENMRLSRLVKQLQEREAHLEHCNQQSEKEVRKLEEQLLALLVRQPQQQSSGAGQELATGQPAQRPWWHGT